MLPHQSPLHKWQRAFFTYGTVCLVVASLYFAQIVILPLALAILIAFMLNPLAAFLQRRGLRRVFAVLIVITAASVVLLGLLYVVANEATHLASELPKHRTNILNKVQALREAQEGPWRTFWDTVKEIGAAIPGGAKREAVEVKIADTGFPLVQNIAGTTLDFLVQAGVVYLLVLFMLLGGTEIRDRVIGVCGHRNLSVTTKALNDASERISRFLAMQFLVNASYGVMLGIGLLILGVPYALIWGVLAALLRYIPYLGPWIAALFPITMAFAVLPGWGPLAAVLGFIVVLELVSNNVMEPWLYGRSVGISATAYLVTAVFWAWLWGPLGLILCTPITVCLVVVGRYVPLLSAFPALFGDAQVLPTEVSFYQRLLARDPAEASELVEGYCKERPPEHVFDDIFLPTLMETKRAYEAGEITQEDRRYILGGMRRIVDDAVTPVLEEARAKRTDDGAPSGPIRIMALFWDAGGEIGLRLLQSLTGSDNYQWETRSVRRGLREALTRLDDDPPDAVILATVATRNPARLRRYCKQIKERFADLRVLVHAWGQEHPEFRAQMQAAGADDSATGFFEGRRQFEAMTDESEKAGPTVAAR